MDLSEFEEITDLNFDGEDPHIAICHKKQGWSANGKTNALLFKSQSPLVSREIIKSLDGSLPEEVIEKMSYTNMKTSLQEALEDFLKENMSANGEYIWVDVYDFNDDMVAFRFQGELWAVDYQATEDGIVTIGEDLRQASHRELYVDSESGEELIKASFWKEENPLEEESSSEDGVNEGDGQEIDSQDTPQQEEETVEEEIMTTEVQNQEEVVVKSQADLEAIIKAAIEADREKQAALRQQEELEKSTTDIIKGMSEFVEESQVDALVKAVLASEDSVVLMETLTKANEAIVKAKEEAEAEILKVKEEFGKQEAIDAEPAGKTIQKGKRDLSSWVQENKKA